MRRRRIRLSTIKNAIKHSDTKISNIGSASIPTAHTLITTDVGNRSSAGSLQNIKDIAKTDETCNVGDIIKYCNVCIEAGPRRPDDASSFQDNGFLEWALIYQTEQQQLMAITNLGTNTLGDVANKQYRNNCILTGCFPLGQRQSNSRDIVIKIPPKFQKLKIGSNFNLFCYFRSNDSSDVRTDAVRLVTSTIFKCYT